MKTRSFGTKDADRRWYLIDADSKVLGRTATYVASILRGKHKPTYTPHNDGGDFVIVVNAEKIALTGKKESGKMYHHHTGYIGGLKSISFEKLIEKAPERAIESAVKGMMPKNKLSRVMLGKLKVYVGDVHPHSAQQPQALEL